MKPRCRNFDEGGKPLRPCNYRCGFVHPDSPRWKDAPPSNSARPPSGRSPVQPMKSLSRDERSNWMDASTRSRNSASSPERRSGSQTKEPSSWATQKSSWGAPESSREREDTIPSTHGWGEPASFGSGWGGHEPSSSGWAEPIKGDTSPVSTTWGQDPKSPIRMRQPSPPLSSKERHMPPPPTSFPPQQPPPPPPSDSMSVREPSSRPPVGDGSSRAPSASRRGEIRPSTTSKSDKYKAYSNRLILFTEAVQLSIEHVQAVRDSESRRRLANSQRYSHISKEMQTQMDQYVQEPQNKTRELNSRFQDAISKLVDCEIWPEELAVNELPHVQQIQDVQARLETLENMTKSIKGDSQTPSNEEPPGKKRRRRSISDGRDDDSIIDRLEQVEIRVDDVCNEALQQKENLLQTVEARMEEKLRQLHASTSVGDIEMGEIEDAVQRPIPMDIREQIAKISKDHDGFVDEVVELVEKHRDMALEMKKLAKENEALKMKNTELESMHEGFKTDVAHVNSQVEALQSAVKIIQKNPPAPHCASLDQIRRQIREEILGELGPVLDELRAQCEIAVSTSLKQILARLGHSVIS